MKKIAILITCYNRVNTTLKCLNYLFQATIPKDFKFDIYLVDDNSPDKTGKIIKERYPQINVINGNGKLYWNGGMRLAWDMAVKSKDYDFYLWLNDDTYIEEHSIITLINDYFNLKNQNIEALITGSLRDSETKKMTYVGRFKGEIIKPNGLPLECDSIPGNLVLVSKAIFEKTGNLSEQYTHGFGDTDYGLRVIRNGFQCRISSSYVGYCAANDKLLWHDSKLSFKERKKMLFSVTGGNIWEYFLFVKNHRGNLQMVLSVGKTLLRLFAPNFFK